MDDKDLDLLFGKMTKKQFYGKALAILIADKIFSKYDTDKKSDYEKFCSSIHEEGWRSNTRMLGQEKMDELYVLINKIFRWIDETSEAQAKITDEILNRKDDSEQELPK